MNKKIIKITQIVLGLVLIVFGSNKFLGFMPAPELPEDAANYMDALVKTGYMFPAIGAVEIIVALLLLFNKWVPFALILFTPVAVNIMLFHLSLALEGIGPGALVSILSAVLIYFHWANYRPLFD